MPTRRRLKGRTIAALAADGFEKVELIVPLRALKSAGAKVEVVSLRRGRIRGVNLHMPASRVRVVVNQLRPGMFGGDRPAEQVAAALDRYVGVEPAAVVPYDRQGVDSALLAGQALREARPGCPAQVALARLAAVLFPAPAAPPRHARRRSRRPGRAAATTESGP